MSYADWFEEVLQLYSVKDLAHQLSLHEGTLRRWLLTRKVPSHVASDLNRLLNYKYGHHNPFLEYDCFYTKPDIATQCLRIFNSQLSLLGVDLSDYYFIEPSIGSGNFYNLLPPDRRIGVELQSTKYPEVIQSDYLDYIPDSDKKYVVIGNPPFGMRGNKALQFLNHSVKFADAVGFILPYLFLRNSRGHLHSRVRQYKLLHSEKLPLESFNSPDGSPCSVPAVFQIWTKFKFSEEPTPKPKTCNTFIKIYSLSDVGTSATTRNKDKLYVCDAYLPSTNFNDIQSCITFDQLPSKRGYGVIFLRNKAELTDLFFNKIDWKNESHRSSNSSYNLNKSIIQKQLIDRDFVDTV